MRSFLTKEKRIKRIRKYPAAVLSALYCLLKLLAVDIIAPRVDQTGTLVIEAVR